MRFIENRLLRLCKHMNENISEHSLEKQNQYHDAVSSSEEMPLSRSLPSAAYSPGKPRASKPDI